MSGNFRLDQKTGEMFKYLTESITYDNRSIPETVLILTPHKILDMVIDQVTIFSVSYPTIVGGYETPLNIEFYKVHPKVPNTVEGVTLLEESWAEFEACNHWLYPFNNNELLCNNCGFMFFSSGFLNVQKASGGLCFSCGLRTLGYR